MGKSIILVEITVKLDFQNGTTPKLDSYSGSSDPGGNNVVTSSGGVDLTKVNKKSDDSTITVLSFKLDTSKNNPALHTAWFAGVTTMDGLGNPYAGPELKAAVLSTQAAILDLDADGQTYQYCLTIAYGNPASPNILSLDPPIVNRAGTS
jgi:hypothetical protein